jgi:antitoxin HicB
MTEFIYDFPACLEIDEKGRYLVQFPDLPEALTDGADEAEALTEASDCLSEALASRIVDGEEIPPPRRATQGMYMISPEPRIALKAALYTALRKHRMTIADLACRLGIMPQTATSHARLMREQGRVEEAHALLASVYGWFTEGFGTKDLKDAKALL